MRNSPFIILLALLVITPLFIYQWISARDKRHDDLVSRYECVEGACNADFDGDGVLGRLVIEWRKDSDVNGDQWLIAYDGGRELLRLPFWRSDNTLRSHAAIRNESDKSRLLIYWGGMRQPENSTSVYVWNDERIIEIAPNDADREILSAMEARDDAGTFHQWVTFRAIKNLAQVGYYILLAAIVFFVYRKSRNNIGRVIRHLP
jgi:hypothetical protein